ncbi:MAG: ABC transporter ATP-binding protein, partial [Mesorhizobium sp.]
MADFIGEANMFQCEVVSVEGDSATVQLGSAVLKLPARGRKPGPAKLAARPSRLEIGGPNAPGT